MYPQSGINDAASTIRGDAIRLGTLTLNPYANIEARPSKSFDFVSFYFGCRELVVSPQVPSIPLGCTIAVTGFDINGKQIPEASYSYSPSNSLGSPMALVGLPITFRNMKNVTIGVATSSLDTTTTILVLDDVVHCNYS